MSTVLIESIEAIRAALRPLRRAGKSIGCVPTMGALHAGHAALIERARAESEIVVVTVFVNPIQFNQKEDYERYARTLEADVELCRSRGAQIVFAPSVQDMYPESALTFVESPELSKHLCGEFRPGHFRGVATVVAKIFNIVQPDLAFFGEKDAQQLAVIEQMVRDLNFPVRIIPVPTVRDPDGLALSSRNQRLTPEERRIAPVLFRALDEARRCIDLGKRNSAVVRRAALDVLSAKPSVRVEYLEVVDARRMNPVDIIAGDVRVAAAVWLGSTRLIDNVLCRKV